MKNMMTVKNTNELRGFSEIRVGSVWYKMVLEETYSDSAVMAYNAYDSNDSEMYEIEVSEIEEVA